MTGTMMAMAAVREPRSYPGWLLNEIASAGRENLDASHVARYDAKEDAGAVDEIVLLRQLGLTRESLVIDIGAGALGSSRSPSPRHVPEWSPSTCRR